MLSWFVHVMIEGIESNVVVVVVFKSMGFKRRIEFILMGSLF